MIIYIIWSRDVEYTELYIGCSKHIQYIDKAFLKCMQKQQ